MITGIAFRGKRYAVLGLARSGLATVDALLESGAEVVAWDDREEARAASLSHATTCAPPATSARTVAAPERASPSTAKRCPAQASATIT